MSTFLGINSVRLEKVEERLKLDVLKEAKALGGLLLVHQELGMKANRQKFQYVYLPFI